MMRTETWRLPILSGPILGGTKSCSRREHPVMWRVQAPAAPLVSPISNACGPENRSAESD